jgi:hypothetical protein
VERLGPAVITSVIGADPGPTTGLALQDWDDGKLISWTVLQVDGDSALGVLAAIMTRRAAYLGTAMVKRCAQVEPFVTGQSAGTRGSKADYTRQQAFALVEELQLWGYAVKLRKAADVKTWASDKRLKAAGILRPPENRHGNDASRHALYTAVHDAYLPDPLR